MNTDRTTPPPLHGLVVLGDALCHTDPAFSWGLSLSLMQARALAADPDAYHATVAPEAQERHALASAIDEARARRWAGEPVDALHAEGCYPLFAFGTALPAAPHDDAVLRRTVRRVGLLDRTAASDEDTALHRRIEEIVAGLPAPPPAGPPRDELLAAISATR